MLDPFHYYGWVALPAAQPRRIRWLQTSGTVPRPLVIQCYSKLRLRTLALLELVYTSRALTSRIDESNLWKLESQKPGTLASRCNPILGQGGK